VGGFTVPPLQRSSSRAVLALPPLDHVVREDAGPPPVDPGGYVPIKRRAEQDRPRERMLSHGPASLSNAELIALLFGSGTRVEGRSISAVDLGQALLRAHPSLSALARLDAPTLARVARGVGPAKAVQLAAAFELGRRVEAEIPDDKPAMRSPADVAARYGPRLRDLRREVFVVVLLDTAGRAIGDFTVSEGGLATSIVEPRAVFQRAVLENAAAIICLHNHPSGNPEPSREDVQITRQLADAGRVMGIPVHDHVIIAGRGFTSMAERGLL
jgi:DNA repair protein RadC